MNARSSLTRRVSRLRMAVTLVFIVGLSTLISAQEAPMLAEQVAAGNLPALEDRLPTNPLVVEVVEEIGDYGGTWNTGLLGGGDFGWFQRTIAYENLVNWNPDWTGVQPNIAESYSVNEDATEYTFTLREGMKWSDGMPFTADDIMFWYNDIELNEDITADRGSNPATVVKINDYEVKFVFEEPKGVFLQTAASVGCHYTCFPAHYLQQFHADYVDEAALQAKIDEEGVADWVALIRKKGVDRNMSLANPELPTLYAWTFQNAYGDGSTRVNAQRNPYYWKVDAEGNQLPYIDVVSFELFDNAEVFLLKILNGEIDLQDRHIATDVNKPVIFDNQEAGNYRLFETNKAEMNTSLLALNLNSQDPVKREVFNNKDFRIGMSHAINRQEVIDVVFVGQGEPWQAAPLRGTPFFNETLAKQYTEYDPDLANEYLDKVMPEKDSDGFRIGPDGNRFTFIMEITEGFTAWAPDVMELVKGYWNDVGVDVQVKNEDRSLMFDRFPLGVHDAMLWQGDGGNNDALLRGFWYMPITAANESGFAMWAPNWGTWAQGISTAPDGSVKAEEPPQAIKDQVALYKELLATGDEAQQIELYKQILDIAQEEFWVMGIGTYGPGYGIVNNNMRNVPQTMPHAWLFPTPAPTKPEQYFFINGDG